LKKYLTAGIYILFLLLMAPQVFGETILFGDNTIYWEGWASVSSDPNRDNYRNSHDVLGAPNILGGSATINDNGYLTNLTFNVLSTRGDDWPLLKPADLFIDIDNNKTWDYVVNMITYNPATGAQGTGDRGLYVINQPLYNSATNNNYIMSYIPGINPLTTRANHPIGVYLDGDQAISTVAFGGWPDALSTGATTAVSFNFDAQNGVYLGNKSYFAVGWTVNCANDVIYEQIDPPVPVPEPGTLLLLGAGIIGLAVMRRKRFFAKPIG
jgi:hypothetical protein